MKIWRKREQIEPGASIERVKTSEVAPEKIERLKTPKDQVRAIARVRCTRHTVGASMVMSFSEARCAVGGSVLALDRHKEDRPNSGK